MASGPQIVAFGGGGFSMEPGNRLLDDYVLSLPGVERPRVCFLPTASGDADHYVVRFYRAFPATRCEPSHISLFRRDKGSGIDADVGAHLLEQDLIYVGGGSVVSLLGVWRAHGLDEILRACWQRGTVLCGLSAGSLCWFSEAITAFHGAPQRVCGLGLLPWSNCVHYDGEPTRRDAYHGAVAAGMVPGYGVEDGAALHFVGSELARVVSSRPTARAYRVEAADGAARESPLPALSLRDAEGLVLA
ncbi:MAG: dipeptidase [Solirubrobacteraceae bacterium]|nr:dipeptidase [Solirubrobacteraceae bacterium]